MRNRKDYELEFNNKRIKKHYLYKVQTMFK